MKYDQGTKWSRISLFFAIDGTRAADGVSGAKERLNCAVCTGSLRAAGDLKTGALYSSKKRSASSITWACSRAIGRPAASIRQFFPGPSHIALISAAWELPRGLRK